MAIAAFDEWKQATPETVAAGEVLVACDENGSPCAYGIFNRSFFRRPWIATLFVHRDHRRRGFGNALLDHMEQACGSSRIWISTELPNLAMQSLLSRRDYRLTGVVENLQKNPEMFYFKDIAAPPAAMT